MYDVSLGDTVIEALVFLLALYSFCANLSASFLFSILGNSNIFQLVVEVVVAAASGNQQGLDWLRRLLGVGVFLRPQAEDRQKQDRERTKKGFHTDEWSVFPEKGQARVFALPSARDQ